MTASLAESAWFAGFVDGEAAFLINRAYPLDKGGHYVVLSIRLRADDLPILERLQATFGGTLRFECYREDRGKGSNPLYTWNVSAKRALKGLVDYFDRFPLQAKKANDYAIWRRAVLAYCREGRKAPELGPLRDALIAGRRFEADAAELPEQIAALEEQLRLDS